LKDSLGASVAKEMCFQRSSEGIEGKLNVHDCAQLQYTIRHRTVL